MYICICIFFFKYGLFLTIIIIDLSPNMFLVKIIQKIYVLKYRIKASYLDI